MKILRFRSHSYIVNQLLVLAPQFKWCARTIKDILSLIFARFQILKKPSLGSLYTLQSDLLRKVIRLCEIIVKNPDQFDNIFNKFATIPLGFLQVTINEYREYIKNLPRKTRREILKKTNSLLIVQ